ncbi:protein of unknown function (plasmid) [Shinella sp. WSC3-e]|jgi:hypothetical protein|nr:hypothetical protein SHINE37_90057 [Rhizobiaceae bacterium]CAK7262278.1 protein of unknown function [Shinella sp. WSC3-e]
MKLVGLIAKPTIIAIRFLGVVLRRFIFAVLFALVGISVVFSVIGVLAVWNPMELF